MNQIADPQKSRMTKIYYLPGFGGRLHTRLGQTLSDRGHALFDRETVGEFRDLTFSQQIALVAEYLRTCLRHLEAKVIANSIGAYLFLHAQTLLSSFVGRVLLLSPIECAFENEE